MPMQTKNENYSVFLYEMCITLQLIDLENSNLLPVLLVKILHCRSKYEFFFVLQNLDECS